MDNEPAWLTKAKSLGVATGGVAGIILGDVSEGVLRTQHLDFNNAGLYVAATTAFGGLFGAAIETRVKAHRSKQELKDEVKKARDLVKILRNYEDHNMLPLIAFLDTRASEAEIGLCSKDRLVLTRDQVYAEYDRITTPFSALERPARGVQTSREI